MVITKGRRPIGAGIIGPGGIGSVHREALRRIGVDVVAVAASSEARARWHAERLDIPRACLPDELIRLADVDVVHICTPNYLHAPLAEDALLNGKHVVCEKPLATSAEKAWRLVRLAEDQGLIAAVCYGFRYYVMPRLLRAMVANGDLGDIHLVRGGYLLEEVLLHAQDHWYLDPHLMGEALTLNDVGVHWWDLAELVIGARVSEVVCTLHSVRSGKAAPPGDDSDGILLRFDNGAAGVAAMSHTAAGHNNTFDLEIFGTQGSARWDEEDPDHLWFRPRGEPARLLSRSPKAQGGAPATLQLAPGLPHGFNDAFRDLMASIYSNVAGTESLPFPTFEDGARGITVVEALLRSADERRWVTVEARR